MARMFETREITKLLDVLIGQTEAVGETNEDNRRLDNLKTLIDVTNWCLDGLEFAMASGRGRPEYSMAKIRHTAQCALDEYGRWIADILDEQMADRKTEPQFAKDINVRSKDEPQTDIHDLTDCDFCKDRNCKDCEGGKDEPQTCDTCRFEVYCPEMCEGCCEWDSHYEPKDEPQTCSVSGRPYTDCCNCEYFKCTADEPQTYGYMTAEQIADYRKMLDNAEHKVYGNVFENEPQTIIGERFPSYITENNAQVLDGWQTNPRILTTAVEDELKMERNE